MPDLQRSARGLEMLPDSSSHIVHTGRVHSRNLQRDMEKEVACQGVRRLREELRPEHRTPVPSRLRVNLDFDPLLLARRCKPCERTSLIQQIEEGRVLAGFLNWLPSVSHEEAVSP